MSDKAAAVLVPLYEDSNGDIRVVLTLRSSKLSSHAGTQLGPRKPSPSSLVDAENNGSGLRAIPFEGLVGIGELASKHVTAASGAPRP